MASRHTMWRHKGRNQRIHELETATMKEWTQFTNLVGYSHISKMIWRFLHLEITKAIRPVLELNRICQHKSQILIVRCQQLSHQQTGAFLESVRRSSKAWRHTDCVKWRIGQLRSRLWKCPRRYQALLKITSSPPRSVIEACYNQMIMTSLTRNSMSIVNQPCLKTATSREQVCQLKTPEKSAKTSRRKSASKAYPGLYIFRQESQKEAWSISKTTSWGINLIIINSMDSWNQNWAKHISWVLIKNNQSKWKSGHQIKQVVVAKSLLSLRTIYCRWRRSIMNWLKLELSNIGRESQKQMGEQLRWQRHPREVVSYWSQSLLSRRSETRISSHVRSYSDNSKTVVS